MDVPFKEWGIENPVPLTSRYFGKHIRLTKLIVSKANRHSILKHNNSLALSACNLSPLLLLVPVWFIISR
jgi:hypothetical protein